MSYSLICVVYMRFISLKNVKVLLNVSSYKSIELSCFVYIIWGSLLNLDSISVNAWG